eukprot:5781204-Pyramimonas_sp.AAC.1
MMGLKEKKTPLHLELMPRAWIKRTFHELGAYVSLLEISDSNLLYPLLGDGIKPSRDEPSKMDLIL